MSSVENDSLASLTEEHIEGAGKGLRSNLFHGVIDVGAATAAAIYTINSIVAHPNAEAITLGPIATLALGHKGVSELISAVKEARKG